MREETRVRGSNKNGTSVDFFWCPAGVSAEVMASARGDSWVSIDCGSKLV